jgi:crotonobetainyl-CoA:carnitine CoA-transferase CaiB-like acyl-CoA transferase
MSVTGTPDGPPVRLGVAVADLAAGMFAFQGLLAAIIARGRTGRGQFVEVALLDAVTALLTYQAERYLTTGTAPTRAGNRHASIAPYDAFQAADGMLILAIGSDALWLTFCRAAGLTDLAADPTLATNAGRVQAYATLRPRLSAAVGARRRDEWIGILRAAGVPTGAVRTIDEALADPQIAARDMVARVAHPTIGALDVLGIPVKLSDTPGAVRSAPPLLGQHTRAVLGADAGLDEDAIERLRLAGVIREA